MRYYWYWVDHIKIFYLFIYIYIYLCVIVCIYIYIHIYIHTYIYTYIYIPHIILYVWILCLSTCRFPKRWESWRKKRLDLRRRTLQPLAKARAFHGAMEVAQLDGLQWNILWKWMDFEVPTFRTQFFFGREFWGTNIWKPAKQHPRIHADVPDEHQAGAETSSLEGRGSDSTEAAQTSTGWLGDPGPANAAEISQKYPLMSSMWRRFSYETYGFFKIFNAMYHWQRASANRNRVHLLL